MDKILAVWAWLTNSENQKAILGLLAFAGLVSTALTALIFKIVGDYKAAKQALTALTSAVEQVEIKEKAGIISNPPAAKSIKRDLRDDTSLTTKARKEFEDSVDKSKEKFLDLKNRMKGR